MIKKILITTFLFLLFSNLSFAESNVFPSSVLGFQGQFSDPDTNLNFLGARVYNADTAQFLSPDSFPAVTSQPSSVNRYAYSHNDPVNFWDITGTYGIDLHYGKTKDWAYQAALNIGFSNDMSRQFALNIASFDQYHDKEWSLAPNNYSMGNGQGNSLHFTNPNRQQINGNEVLIGNNAPFANDIVANSIKNNEYVDPLVISVGATTIPVYAMKSLNEFNTAEGAKILSNDPRALRDGKAMDYLTLNGGTAKDRLQQAVKEHDPRLFGIALHEYQDSFAHAGFNEWHGPSSDNDIYCDTGDTRLECLYNTIGDNGVTATDEQKRQLYERDRLMQEGTKYWMAQFVTKQADYYQEQLEKTSTYNKEEKMMNEGQIKSMNVTEEWDNPQFINNLGGKFGVYFEQGKGVGNASCLNLFKSLASPADLQKKNPECGKYIMDLTNQITR